jgi:hypothetical protein
MALPHLVTGDAIFQMHFRIMMGMVSIDSSNFYLSGRGWPPGSSPIMCSSVLSSSDCSTYPSADSASSPVFSRPSHSHPGTILAIVLFLDVGCEMIKRWLGYIGYLFPAVSWEQTHLLIFLITQDCCLMYDIWLPGWLFSWLITSWLIILWLITSWLITSWLTTSWLFLLPDWLFHH